MSESALLTIGIPVSGQGEAASLERTLNAIHQVLPGSDIEVLVQVNEAAPSEWAMGIGEHAVQPKVECQTDHGIYDAMNRLTERATGARILFLGAGDAPLTGLQRALDRWETVEDVLELGGVRIPNAEPRVPRHYPARWDRTLRWRNVTHHQGIAYPLTLLRTFGGFRTEYKVLADYALNIDMWQEGVQARWTTGEDWVSAAPGGVSRQFSTSLYDEERRMKAALLKPGMAKVLLSLWMGIKARWKRA